MNQQPTRRSFLRNTGLAVAGAALARPLAALAADEAKKKVPVGVQLYSVRNELKTDFNGVIEKLGKMGFQGVEFYGGIERSKSAKELRKLLDDNGLKTCGTHTALITLQGDALKSTIDFHKELGNRFLIAPSLQAKDEAGWLALAKQFNSISAKAKEQDMAVGFHAHGGDFKKYGDKTAWEIFFDNTDKEVIHQVDVGNTLSGGGDPLAMIKKYPGRTKSTHVKEHGGAKKDAPIGEGAVNWKEMFEAYETIGGIEWYVVEYEHPNPLEKLKVCIENMRKMGR